VEVEILLRLPRVLPAAVKNVGVNVYVNDIHQPNVTNLFIHNIFLREVTRHFGE
jgi:hypothetical protein